MCIAIFKPIDKTIDKDTLKRCSEANPDGCGFAYIKDGIIYLNKFMDFETFYTEYSKVETTSPMLIHFRIATHGAIELKNCHPFKLNNHMALVHNGVISGYGDKATKSDTVDFIDKVIGKISYKMWKNPAFRTLVGNAIGYSKFAILDIDGNHYIINEDKGIWDNGIWYSNSSYKPKVVYYTTSKQTKLFDDEDDYESQYIWYKKCLDKQEEYKKKEKKSKDIDDRNLLPECDSDDDYVCCIYECKKCGKKYYDDYYNDTKCVACNSSEVEDIGYHYRGEDYMYEEQKV